MRKINFALLGCGRIASKYVAALTSGAVPHAALVAVCDPRIERAKALVGELAVPAFSHHAEMMERMGAGIDAVVVLTPSGLHARNTVELAAYGKHIVVEKPMALTLADADRMIRACEDAGVRLFVVKQNRHNPAVRRLREALDAGRFGALFLATARVRWCRTQDYYDEEAWRGSVADDGGVFANQASHHLDLLQWLAGEVESVFAKTSRAVADIETDDTGVAVLRFRNRALGVIEATTATRPADLEGSISILGERGSVEIAGLALDTVRTWSFVEPEPGDREMQQWRNPSPQGHAGHAAHLEHVAACIRDRRPALVDGREARKSLALFRAIYESAAQGREIFLP